MTKYILYIIASLLLVACATPQKILSDAENKCPDIGINIRQPDFYQKHTRRDVEEFYDCMESELRPSGRPLLGAAGSPARNMFSHDDEIKTSIQPLLEYQRNLWREVLSKEKKPGAAYEAWVAWVQNERSISASNQAAANAARAASAADNTNLQLQQQNMQLQQIQQQQFLNGR